MTTGVLVSRLQVYELKDAHTRSIAKIMNMHDNFIMVLRVSRIPSTKNNPLDAATRKAMVQKSFPGINVITVSDQPLKEIWSSLLDNEIQKHAGGDVTLYGSANDLVKEYRGKYKTEELNEVQSPTVENFHVSEGEQATVLFRKGVFYAVQKQYTKVYPTVDIAIFKGDKLLLAKKKNVEGYRFPGGFTDPSDESYEAAAAREAEEETGIKIKDVKYIGSVRVDDWRYREEQDKIITTLFSAEYHSGDPAAQDDISEITWFDPSTLDEEMFVHEHRPLFRLLIQNANL